MNDGEALTIVLWVGGLAFAVITGLCGVIVTLLLRRADLSERRSETRDSATGRRNERQAEREAETAGDLSELRANVSLLMAERGKCDALSNEVAVLKDFKVRAEDKFDEVDEASRELRAMAEQIKTLFTIVQKLPSEVATTLMDRLRAKGAAA